MKAVIRALFMLLAVQLVACQSPLPALPIWQSPEGRDHPQAGLIVDLRTDKTLTAAQLIERLATAEQVLVGEAHDNPDHHAVQLWLLRALAAEREQGSVLLEMLTPDQQPLVNQVQADLAAGHRRDDLLDALAWQRGWPWWLYGPLVEYALQQQYPLLAANLNRSEVLQIYRSAPVLMGDASTRYTVRQALKQQIGESHCGMLSASQLGAMLAVQQQRDRRMAQSVINAAQPSLLIAGSFHARKDLGVPLHLQDLKADQGTQVLVLAQVGSTVTAEQADFVWYTPAQPEQDHCADFRTR